MLRFLCIAVVVCLAPLLASSEDSYFRYHFDGSMRKQYSEESFNEYVYVYRWVATRDQQANDRWGYYTRIPQNLKLRKVLWYKEYYTDRNGREWVTWKFTLDEATPFVYVRGPSYLDLNWMGRGLADYWPISLRYELNQITTDGDPTEVAYPGSHVDMRASLTRYDESFDGEPVAGALFGTRSGSVYTDPNGDAQVGQSRYYHDVYYRTFFEAQRVDPEVKIYFAVDGRSASARIPFDSFLDVDQDKMQDDWERSYGLNPRDASDAHGDVDGDGSTNFAEYARRTNPLISDTDQDGILDGSDPWPLNVETVPPTVVLGYPVANQRFFPGDLLSVSAALADNGRVVRADVLLNGVSAAAVEGSQVAEDFVAPDQLGPLVVTVVAYDFAGNSHSESLTVTIADPITADNDPPVVTAGVDQLLDLSYAQVAHLSGRVDDDGKPDPPGVLVTEWSQVAGPEGATIEAPASLTSEVGLTAPGTYTFRLSADDGAASAEGDVSVHAQAWPSGPFLVSRDQEGNAVGGSGAHLSPSGRLVFFSSGSSSIDVNDRYPGNDVFIFDRLADEVQVLTDEELRSQVSEELRYPSVSSMTSNEEAVVFADKGVPFVRLGLDPREMMPLAVARHGDGALAYGAAPCVSSDGRKVAWFGDVSVVASDVVPSGGGLVMWDALTDRVTVLSRLGRSPASLKFADGQLFFAYGNLYWPGFYSLDLESLEVSEISVDESGASLAHSTIYGDVDAHARTVIFLTYYQEWGYGPTPPPVVSIYIKDLASGALSLISTFPSDLDYSDFMSPAISGDGRRVAYWRSDEPGDEYDNGALYVRDVVSGVEQAVVSVPAGQASYQLSYDGSALVLITDQALDPAHDANRDPDVYLFSLPPVQNPGSVTQPDSSPTDGNS
ncbi:MAG: hypothetical protein PF961_00305 [Planctomycetota bacterium]|jgi:hypothetical protein|nr:hypothetical protein [Planctomycetota bacterium]